jgi:hypothetical protein
MIPSLFYGTLLGTISGIVWAFALGSEISIGLKYGSISGLIFGFIFFLFQKAATAPGNIQKKEAMFVASSVMTMTFMASVVIAIITGLIRWIF